ncbi:MAG: response regulator transcription factor [Clostridiales bacterium]|nr:response regulator transcription factor [Clostridiales bacterium]
MYKIYVVEDDKGIADGISQCLAAWEMEVVTVSDFRNVIGEINEIGPHLIIMDITLPYMGGYHWCREIRKTSNVPIIFISSATDNMNIIMAMNMGADDYIPKPFDQSILIAKVQALLRRTYDFSRNTFSLSAGGAVLNTDDNTLTFEGKKIELARNEYKILLVLMQNKNKVVSREKLMEALWETDSFVDENTLTVNVGRLRKTLESAGLKDLIKTKFGVGYILEDEE